MIYYNMLFTPHVASSQTTGRPSSAAAPPDAKHLCQASKFAERPDVQQRIVEAPSVEGRDGHRPHAGS